MFAAAPAVEAWVLVLRASAFLPARAAGLCGAVHFVQEAVRPYSLLEGFSLLFPLPSVMGQARLLQAVPVRQQEAPIPRQ